MKNFANKFVCNMCSDTHQVWSDHQENWLLCKDCPLPCNMCASNGVGAYCGKTPCDCQCHIKNQNTNDWYVGPLTKERLADLRLKLAKARGLLISFTDPDPQYHPDLEEVGNILKETEDP